MKLLQRMMANFHPIGGTVNAITEITPEWLKRRGIVGIISDLDNNLAITDGCPDLAVTNWVNEMKKQTKKVVIVTYNHRHPFITHILNHFGLTFDDVIFSVLFFRRRAIEKAIAKIGDDTETNRILYLDDFIFGIHAANKCGCYTVLVKPISRKSEKSHPLLLIARALEFFIKKYLNISFPNKQALNK